MLKSSTHINFDGSAYHTGSYTSSWSYTVLL